MQIVQNTEQLPSRYVLHASIFMMGSRLHPLKPEQITHRQITLHLHNGETRQYTFEGSPHPSFIAERMYEKTEAVLFCAGLDI